MKLREKGYRERLGGEEGEFVSFPPLSCFTALNGLFSM